VNSISLIRASLAHYWRTNLAVVAGVAAAVTVLSGALLVGDSVRGSLRDLVEARLGATDLAVVSQDFFRAALADDLKSDAAFARDFFGRFIQGRELADYSALLRRAGILVRRTAPGRAWIGEVRFDDRSGTVRLASPPPFGSPIYAAGLDVDDEIRQVDGARIRSFAELTAALGRRRPGDRIAVAFADRSGRQRTSTITLAEDPAFELVPVERGGGSLTPAQRAFREQWVN